jgi:hypothetical protein
MAIKDELEAIKQADKGGLLHAHAVISYARTHTKSELHGVFEWDDNKAAEEYRLFQARHVIQYYFVSEEGTPQLVSLTVDRSKGGGYRAINDVVTNERLGKVMLQDALAELRRAQVKFQRVKELMPVWRAIDRVSKLYPPESAQEGPPPKRPRKAA